MSKNCNVAQSIACCALAALSLSPALLTPTLAAPPDGMAAINYNRCDSDYRNWGVHLFQRGPGGPAVPGVSWTNPMEPTGKNDFGVYWHTKLDNFPGGKVNYIIHSGDNKEQGGKDMQFDSGEAKEIWVNSGDRKIYTSLDDAKQGRAAAPCK